MRLSKNKRASCAHRSPFTPISRACHIIISIYSQDPLHARLFRYVCGFGCFACGSIRLRCLPISRFALNTAGLLRYCPACLRQAGGNTRSLRGYRQGRYAAPKRAMFSLRCEHTRAFFFRYCAHLRHNTAKPIYADFIIFKLAAVRIKAQTTCAFPLPSFRSLHIPKYRKGGCCFSQCVSRR